MIDPKIVILQRLIAKHLNKHIPDESECLRLALEKIEENPTAAEWNHPSKTAEAIINEQGEKQ